MLLLALIPLAAQPYHGDNNVKRITRNTFHLN